MDGVAQDTEWQQRGMRIFWQQAMGDPHIQVGFYRIYEAPYGLRCFHFSVDDPDERDPRGRVIGWTQALSEMDHEYHPERGVIRDLYALPLTPDPPGSKPTKLTAGKLLWFLEQFELLSVIPSRHSLGLPDPHYDDTTPSSPSPPLSHPLPLDSFPRPCLGPRQVP